MVDVVDRLVWRTTDEKIMSAVRTGIIDSRLINTLKTGIRQNQTTFIAIPAFLYSEWLMILCSELSKDYNKIGYGTFVWPWNVMFDRFVTFNNKISGTEIDLEKFFFIDGVRLSTLAKKKEDYKPNIQDYLFHPVKTIMDNVNTEPDNFERVDILESPEKLVKSILSIVQKRSINPFILDSLHVFTHYFNKKIEIVKLAHRLITGLNELGVKSIFPFSIEKESLTLAKDLGMFAEATIILRGR